MTKIDRELGDYAPDAYGSRKLPIAISISNSYTISGWSKSSDGFAPMCSTRLRSDRPKM
jgi:hypothetical protein